MYPIQTLPAGNPTIRPRRTFQQRPLFGYQPDTFQGTSQISGWQQALQFQDKEALSEVFRENTTQGLKQMWNKLPGGLRKDVQQAGWRVVLTPDLHTAFRAILENEIFADKVVQDKERHHGEDFLNQRIQVFFEKVKTDPDVHKKLSGLLEEGKRDNAAPLQMRFLEAALKGDLSVLSEQDQKRAFIHFVDPSLAGLGNTPSYLYGAGHIVIPEKIIEPNASKLSTEQLKDLLLWKEIEKSPSTMERTIRHETIHFIDEKLGLQKLGHYFSADPRFRLALLEDQAEAKRQGLWPKFEDRAADGPYKGALLAYYFPEDFEESPDSYNEAFAECTSTLLGGGILEPAYVQKLLPKTTAWIRENVLKPYQPQPKTRWEKFLDFLLAPFRWIKEKLNKLLGWFSGNKAAGTQTT